MDIPIIAEDNSSQRAEVFRVSIIVPVKNESATIALLLDDLMGQTHRPAEIIVTDGGSTDGTIAIIEAYEKSGVRVRLLREQAALPGRGRNVAAERALCEWLAFIDAGIRPAPDWLAKLVERIELEPETDVVYGNWEPVTESFFEECAAIAYVPPPIEIDGELIRPTHIPSSLMRREVWRAVGGFPEHLRSAEDLLFMNKIEEAGFRIARAPQAVVWWSIQPTLWRTFKRFVSYSRHNIRAGLWKQWQAAIFKRYALLALVAALAFVFGKWWLLVTVALWLLMLAARGVVAIGRNARIFPAGVGRNALRLLMLIPIIATLDAATFAGSLDWVLRDKLRLTGKQPFIENKN